MNHEAIAGVWNDLKKKNHFLKQKIGMIYLPLKRIVCLSQYDMNKKKKKLIDLQRL